MWRDDFGRRCRPKAEPARRPRGPALIPPRALLLESILQLAPSGASGQTRVGPAAPRRTPGDPGGVVLARPRDPGGAARRQIRYVDGPP